MCCMTLPDGLRRPSNIVQMDSIGKPSKTSHFWMVLQGLLTPFKTWTPGGGLDALRRPSNTFLLDGLPTPSNLSPNFQYHPDPYFGWCRKVFQDHLNWLMSEDHPTPSVYYFGWCQKVF